MATKPPEETREPNPFNRGGDCKHPLHQLRTNVQEQLRGQAAKIKFSCLVCGLTWNGADAALPVLHYSYQAEVLRLERMVLKAEAQVAKLEAQAARVK